MFTRCANDSEVRRARAARPFTRDRGRHSGGVGQDPDIRLVYLLGWQSDGGGAVAGSGSSTASAKVGAMFSSGYNNEVSEQKSARGVGS